jgi:hypothetical protein
MPKKTFSEGILENWFERHTVEWRRIREKADNKRPDYAIRVAGNWCIVEVKELKPNDEDKRLIENARNGITEAQWVKPGKRIRKAITKDAERQLRKFSARGFPTIVCVFDMTASFHDEEYHVRAAMYGDETLRFVVPGGSDTAQFVGSGPGRNAVLRRDTHTTISAVGVLRHPDDPVIDLYHNPHATVPIDPTAAAPFVRRQVLSPDDRPKHEGPTGFDVRDDPAYADFFKDPDAAAARVIREILGR